MSFVQGFQAGAQMGKTWLDIYNQANEEARKRKYAEEVAGLRTTRDLPMEYTPVGAPAPTTPPVLQNVVSPTALGLQPAPAAVRPPMRAPAPTAPVPVDRRGPVRPMTENIPESQMYQQRAAVASKYGLTDEMTRLQERASEAGRYESEQAQEKTRYEQDLGLRQRADARAQAEADRAQADRDRQTRTNSALSAVRTAFPNLVEATDEDINRIAAEQGVEPADLQTLYTKALDERNSITDARQRNALDKAERELSALYAQGIAVGIEQINEIIENYALDTKTAQLLRESHLNRTGYDTELATAEMEAAVRELNENATSLNDLNAYLRSKPEFDPMPGDNTAPFVMKDPEDGMYKVYYNNQVLTQYEPQENWLMLVDQVGAMLEGKGAEWLIETQKRRQEAELKSAQADYYSRRNTGEPAPANLSGYINNIIKSEGSRGRTEPYTMEDGTPYVMEDGSPIYRMADLTPEQQAEVATRALSIRPVGLDPYQQGGGLPDL